MLITAEYLRKFGACDPDVKKFGAEWPNGAEITAENCIRAFVKLGLDPNWAARHFLSAQALAEYAKIRDTVWAWYRKVEAEAGTEYEKLEADAEYMKIAALTFYRLLEEEV